MKAEVIEVIQETPLVNTLKLKLDQKVTFKPGQFICLIFRQNEDGKDKIYRRSYSISHWQEQPTDILTITLNESINGKFSRKIMRSIIGDTFEVDGPHGVFALKETENPLLFISAGTGITPLMTMIEAVKDANKDMTCLYSIKKLENAVFKKQLEDLEKGNKLKCHLTITEDVPEGWNGFTGRITKEMIEKILQPNSEVYICGMPDFVKLTLSFLEELKVPKEQIYTERW